MAPRPNFLWATSNCQVPADNFFIPRSSVFLIHAPANGSKLARRFRQICINFWTPSPLRMAAVSKLPANISDYAAMRSADSKLTLRAQAPYTFSS